MNFLLVNQHTLNFGDDIAGTSLIKQIFKFFPSENTTVQIVYNTPGSLKYPDKRVVDRNDVLLKDMGRVQIFLFMAFSLLGIQFVYKESLKAYKRMVQDADVILVSPGGANLGMYKDWRYLIKLYMVVVFKGRPIFHNNTIEYSNNWLFNIFEKIILNNSRIYVREMRSYNHLQEKGFFPMRGVDTAFSFVEEDTEPLISENYLVFIPTNLDDWHPNFKKEPLSNKVKKIVLKELAELSKQENLSIVILQHMHGSATENDLYDECKRQLVGLGVKTVSIPKIESCYQYDNVIRNSKFVASMRYHGVVMAIKNKTPFCSLEYENKMAEVCRYSQLMDLNIKLKDIDESFNLMSYYTLGTKEVSERVALINKIEDMATAPLKQLKYGLTSEID